MKELPDFSKVARNTGASFKGHWVARRSRNFTIMERWPPKVTPPMAAGLLDPDLVAVLPSRKAKARPPKDGRRCTLFR